MSKKREEIILRKLKSFALQTVLLLTILYALVMAAVLNVVSWEVVLIGGVLVTISTVGDGFSMLASVLFRFVMLPASIKRKNDRSVFFED